ncbi:MAG: hydrogenase maturation protease [Calditrichia bacterium]
MKDILILGIGNLLMGDEGIGIHVVRRLQEDKSLKGIDIVDGGTGGFHLLNYFHEYKRVILVDATIDGRPAGTVRMLKPRFSSDYPPTLTAHDIGLKDLLDALYLLDEQPEIVLFTISIEKLDKVTLDISPDIQRTIGKAAERIAAYIKERGLLTET